MFLLSEQNLLLSILRVAVVARGCPEQLLNAHGCDSHLSASLFHL
jgi:hypothetical protein